MGQIVPENTVLDRAVMELRRLGAEDPTDTWLSTLDNVIDFSYVISNGFLLVRGVALSIVQERWEELPLDTRKRYGYAFMNYAIARTKKNASTVRNYIRVAQTWILSDRDYPTVEIPKRLDDGRPVKDESRWVQFTPLEVDYTKLLRLTAQLEEKGGLPASTWKLLADDYYEVSDIERALHEKNAENGKPYFYAEGPLLFLVRDGIHYPLAELIWDDYDNDENYRDAMDHLFSKLNVAIDEDKVRKATKAAYAGLS